MQAAGPLVLIVAAGAAVLAIASRKPSKNSGELELARVNLARPFFVHMPPSGCEKARDRKAAGPRLATAPPPAASALKLPAPLPSLFLRSETLPTGTKKRCEGVAASSKESHGKEVVRVAARTPALPAQVPDGATPILQLFRSLQQVWGARRCFHLLLALGTGALGSRACGAAARRPANRCCPTTFQPPCLALATPPGIAGIRSGGVPMALVDPASHHPCPHSLAPGLCGGERLTLPD